MSGDTSPNCAPDLAIFAGRGALPAHIARAHPAWMVRFGTAPDGGEGTAIAARFEQLGKLFAHLRAAGVARVCLAGAMERPALDPEALDPFTAAKMPMLMAAMGQGDDALLRAVIALIESEGFAVIGAAELCPDLLAPAGVVVGAAPSDAQLRDSARARAVLDALGGQDVGQSAVAARGQILGVETLQGTDAMLGFVGASAPGSDGVMVKRPKPGQELRADMPAIGPETVRAAAAAGLSGIEIAAGAVMILERAAVEADCVKTGLSLWAAP